MKIAFINGSPKINNTASGCILEDLKTFLVGDNNIINEFHFTKPQIKNEELLALKECDALIFAVPLYVDSIPSHLLSCLIQLESFFSSNKSNKKIMVYTLINCGFYEGHQNKLTTEMMQVWCEKSSMIWGQGIGIGAGGMIIYIKKVPLGRGPKKNLGVALRRLAKNILNCASEENIYITANIPRFLYKFVAEF
ncbi:MAG: hypothetical protein ACRC0V_09850, partial [Fusobacteriaceae bacterium]